MKLIIYLVPADASEPEYPVDLSEVTDAERADSCVHALAQCTLGLRRTKQSIDDWSVIAYDTDRLSRDQAEEKIRKEVDQFKV